MISSNWRPTTQTWWTFQLSLSCNGTVGPFFSFENPKLHYCRICRLFVNDCPPPYTHYITMTTNTVLCFLFAYFPSHLVCDTWEGGQEDKVPSSKDFFFTPGHFPTDRNVPEYLTAMIRADFCATFIICKSTGYNRPFSRDGNEIISSRTSIKPEKLKQCIFLLFFVLWKCCTNWNSDLYDDCIKNNSYSF